MIRFRRAVATVLVLWAVAIAAVLLISTQQSAWRQASAGREVLGQVRAKWAARAGVEAAIARLTYDTLQPDMSSATSLWLDLEEVAYGTVGLDGRGAVIGTMVGGGGMRGGSGGGGGVGGLGATWRVETTVGLRSSARTVPGPMDPHSRLNVNVLTSEQLLEIPGMTEPIADAVLDWIDEDDDVRELGAEVGFYRQGRFGYEPRNGPMRSIQELELVAGVDPSDVRGEDWNLNGRLDANEDDGDASWPPDNRDGVLDAGWSAVLTAGVGESPMALGGGERIDLTLAEEDELVAELGVTTNQARVLIGYAMSDGAEMSEFLRTSLSLLANRMAVGAATPVGRVEDLDVEQLRTLFALASIGPMDRARMWHAGRLNVNTAPREAFEYLGFDEGLVDSLVLARDGRAQGFADIVDLLEVPAMTRARLADLVDVLTTRPTVIAVTSRGRDERTGIEIEIVSWLDRSTLPVHIRELRIR